MPRTARNIAAGICYHVLNRGNGRATIFRDETDYAAFVRVAAKASARFPVEVYSYCLMPNHFHLVLCPRADNALAHWMHWTIKEVRFRTVCHGRAGLSGPFLCVSNVASARP